MSTQQTILTQQRRKEPALYTKVGQAYKSVKNDLNSGRIVLFSGTGCQNNGLKKYLGKDYENLYCIDVVCHGVPSPKLWRHYLEHIETINNAKIIGVNFRCKSALKRTEKEVASLEAKKAKADAKAAEEAKKAEAESVVKKLLASGMSADEILEKLK